VRRVSKAVEKRGTLNVLRRGVKLYGCRFDLVYFRPSTGRNPEYRANVFSVVRQLPYSPDSGHTLDLCLFLNGLPLFTAELKNPLTGQTFRDAIHQYRSDRDPREPFFQFGRCLAHFAVGSEEVHMTTRLEGEDTTFLPFNKGYDGGAGNPPSAHGYRTSYLWEEVWTRDSVLNLLQHFIATIEELDNGEPTGKEKLIFPQYHQMRSVRRLVADARENGPGERDFAVIIDEAHSSQTVEYRKHLNDTLSASSLEEVREEAAEG